MSKPTRGSWWSIKKITSADSCPLSTSTAHVTCEVIRSSERPFFRAGLQGELNSRLILQDDLLEKSCAQASISTHTCCLWERELGGNRRHFPPANHI